MIGGRRGTGRSDERRVRRVRCDLLSSPDEHPTHSQGSCFARKARISRAIAFAPWVSSERATASATIGWPCRRRFRIGAASLEIGDEHVSREDPADTRIRVGAGVAAARPRDSLCARASRRRR
jgi:hypothetical protein